ncbi:MAG: hypothetical protein PVF35_03665 [Gammaproteobacteria bacterium]|jgi:hypothetical protein
MNNTKTQNITDTIIHTRKLLSDREFNTLSKEIYRDEGIVSLSRNPHTPRFLMVVYNAARTRSTTILEAVRQHGFQASLVGF